MWHANNRFYEYDSENEPAITSRHRDDNLVRMHNLRFCAICMGRGFSLLVASYASAHAELSLNLPATGKLYVSSALGLPHLSSYLIWSLDFPRKRSSKYFNTPMMAALGVASCKSRE